MITVKKSSSTGTAPSPDPKREAFWALMEDFLDLDRASIERFMANHMEYTQGKEKFTSRDIDFYMSLAYTVRDYLMERSNNSHHHYYGENAKRVYYLSMEYLMGRTLGNALVNLGMYDLAKDTLARYDLDMEELMNFEPDAGLGNGGLGRLAACFLDSMATLSIPSFGYGIHYDYGIFNQKIKDGFQVELPDNWLKFGNPWETLRQDYTYVIEISGRVIQYTDNKGSLRHDWVDTRKALAVPYDTPIPGYGNFTANTLRLWSARAIHEFNLEKFNEGDYMLAVQERSLAETITRVLYPKDDQIKGKTLRLIQEYFFVSASLQDIIRRHKVKNRSLDNLEKKAAIQLNDTHPALAIAELMRILVDKEGYGWEKAWDIVQGTIGYTNHTVLPEALERWPVSLMEEILPRHLQIIYEINRRHLDEVSVRFPGDTGRLARMSIIEETPEKAVRMGHLAVVGSHSVNGVAELHSQILVESVFKDFAELWPEKFSNKTNGITQRRWLLLCNPELAALTSRTIGDGWVKDLFQLREMEKSAKDEKFRRAWREIKQNNKKRLAEYVEKTMGITLNTESIFDSQIKRVHEYKRQLLNVLHTITLYHRIKNNPGGDFVPRTKIFSGKAAPGYFMAKLIIKLINAVAEVVNNDPDMGDMLKVVFMENYSVTLAELIIPASDLSEQISTAGMEASGTGNMKLSLNGALTIGTLDGATIEIREEVGDENIFIFGLTAQEVQELRASGYDPFQEVHDNDELRASLEMISTGLFSGGDRELFKPLLDSLLGKGDFFLVLKDYASYIACQEKVNLFFRNQQKWTEMSILNTCRMGKFSSDRTISEYNGEIWKAEPVVIEQKRRPSREPACSKR
ncbi:MAG: glycogen/starch/alpha-glucan phosphorylase [Candidatus Eremiobacteraeota bacterium]|nr:glycogen/starch/alpha-glucan phosphorylase [Candidatus Eremiobacteraeota bacterium]